MKRIALIYRNLSGLSGVPNVVYAQAEALVKAGYRVDLVAEKLNAARVRQAGVGGKLIRRLPGPGKWRRYRFARRADRLAAKYDFVVGHGHHFRQDVLTLHNCVQLANEIIHGGETGRPDVDAQLQASVLQKGRFRFCVANSNLMKQHLLQRFGVANGKIRVIYPGYDPNRFNAQDRQNDRDSIRRKLDVRESQLLIGLITSGAFEKRGVDLFLRALSELPESVKRSVKVMIAGKPSRPDHYLKMIEALGLTGMVCLKPAVPDVEKYFHALDIAVHPARFEEFGLTVVEAMACGVPVIINKRVGAAELLPPEAYNELPEQVDVTQLREQLLRWIESPEQRRCWRDYGLSSAAKATVENNLKTTLALYREAGL